MSDHHCKLNGERGSAGFGDLAQAARGVGVVAAGDRHRVGKLLQRDDLQDRREVLGHVIGQPDLGGRTGCAARVTLHEEIGAAFGEAIEHRLHRRTAETERHHGDDRPVFVDHCERAVHEISA